ncbi:MAG: hypothetical protein LUC94_05700 [Clostridiales bacterium]|nr:hypothetical protein [Clostridiales bacterium]
MEACLRKLDKKPAFKKEELFKTAENCGTVLRANTKEKYLNRLLLNGEIARVGWNAYCVRDELQIYHYKYSDISNHIADILTQDFYDLDFRIMELHQMNRFINHLIMHNVIFVYVEKELCPDVFERLKREYEGKLLIRPTVEDFYYYRTNNIIVVKNLMTESPKGAKIKWHTGLEKLLVDLFADKLIRSMIGESEYPSIFETAFKNYVIDENRMFRYAGRRKAAHKIKKFLAEETTVKLRTAAGGNTC